MNTNGKFIGMCRDGCGLFSIETEDGSDEFLIDYYPLSYIREQAGILWMIWSRIKMAVSLLFGHGYHLWEVFLDKDEAIKMANFILLKSSKKK